MVRREIRHYSFFIFYAVKDAYGVLPALKTAEGVRQQASFEFEMLKSV
jgi:hypothetical protein